MVTASLAVPTSTDTGQLLPTGFDPGNGSAKLIVNGTEIRIPSLIAPLHSDIYEVPLVRTGSLITYRSGTRTDLINQRWFAGNSAYTYSPNGHQKVVDDRKGKIKFGLHLLLGAIGALPQRSSWKLGLMLSIQDAQAFGKELTESVYATELKPWVSQNLATALKSVDDWRETSASIIAIGGGSMLPAISQLLTLQGISTLDDGCWANARGLARLAQLKSRRAG